MRGGRAVCVVGAGGHAKVVISTLQAAGHAVAAVYDDDPAKWGKSVLGVPVSGPTSNLQAHRPSGPVVIAVGDNALRKSIAERLGDLDWLSVVHPHSAVHETVKLGHGTVVFAGVVIQPDTAFGDHCIVNTGATVDHDCRIGCYSHLAPGTHTAGGVSLGDGVLLGIGSSALPARSIGHWAVVGAGAVVTRDLPPGVTAVGVPAKPILQPVPAPGDP